MVLLYLNAEAPTCIPIYATNMVPYLYHESFGESSRNTYLKCTPFHLHDIMVGIHGTRRIFREGDFATFILWTRRVCNALILLMIYYVLSLSIDIIMKDPTESLGFATKITARITPTTDPLRSHSLWVLVLNHRNNLLVEGRHPLHHPSCSSLVSLI